MTEWCTDIATDEAWRDGACTWWPNVWREAKRQRNALAAADLEVPMILLLEQVANEWNGELEWEGDEGGWRVYFQREKDLTIFLLRWA